MPTQWMIDLFHRNTGGCDFRTSPFHLHCQLHAIRWNYWLPLWFCPKLVPAAQDAGCRSLMDTREGPQVVWTAWMGPYWHNPFCQSVAQSGHFVWSGVWTQLPNVCRNVQREAKPRADLPLHLHRFFIVSPAPVWFLWTAHWSGGPLLHPLILQVHLCPYLCSGPDPLQHFLPPSAGRQERFIRNKCPAVELLWTCIFNSED